MSGRRFGDAGARIVLERCLRGPEVSYFVLTDGNTAVTLGTAQDHKRAFDDDRGPNTGGMGAFAPSPLIDDALNARVLADIVEPVLAGMREEGHPYTGFLYCGLMLTADGPMVIEFNARLGDPEAQVLLPLHEPLLPLLQAAASRTLEARRPGLPVDRRVGVVVASRGYPDTFETGYPNRRPGRSRGDRGRARLSRRHAAQRRTTSSRREGACSPWSAPAPTSRVPSPAPTPAWIRSTSPAPFRGVI